MGNRFVPDTWSPNSRSMDFCAEKGLDKKQIAQELEKMRDHEFRRPYSDWDRVFRNWIRKAIELGTVSVHTSLDHQASELDLVRQPGEDDASFERRIGIAMTMQRYKS